MDGQESYWNSDQAKVHALEDDAIFQFYEEKINELCHFERNEKVLDVGCGNGEITARISSSNSIILTALDYSSPFISTAQTKYPDISWSVHNVYERFPFQDNEFDKVYSVALLQYIPRPKLKFLLSELKRITKPGGIIVQANVPVLSRAHMHLLNYKNSFLYMPFRNLMNLGDIIKSGNFIFGKTGGNYFQSTSFVKRVAKELNLDCRFEYYSKNDGSPKECLYRADIVFQVEED